MINSMSKMQGLYLKLKPPTDRIGLGFGEKIVEFLFFPPPFLERLQRQLVSCAKGGCLSLEFFTRLAVKLNKFKA
jgi:hypothetical protein